MKTRLFQNAVSLVILACLISGLLGGLPLQAAQAASAAPAPLQTAYDCSTNTQIPQAECQALVALYNNTNGPRWDTHTGWLSTTTPCNWYGVDCDTGNTHVTYLFLSQIGLTGSIPPELGSMTWLIVLDLSRNQLSGSIPAQLGNMTQLGRLDLSGNQLSGSIPAQLGNMAQLAVLNLAGNQLSGSIPAELGNLTYINDLLLDYNQLSGSIPPELGKMTNLYNIDYSLDLSHNQLSGSIPPELGDLAQLSGLNLSYNQLSGSIPPELGKLAKLTDLDLSYNQIGGSIPSELGKLTKLTDLDLSYNQIGGSIPPEIGNLTKLVYLYLENNQLSGSIPPELGNLTKLPYLYLNNNQLSGSIPPEMGTMASMNYLHLENNQLSGSIPAELSNQSYLIDIYLNGNQLSGSIPAGLGGLNQLETLDLHDNQLSGAIPPELGLGDLGKRCCVTLDFSNNQLSGSIPPELGNLELVTLLNLSHNQLSASIPAQLGNPQQIGVLDLSHNQLSGNIPPELDNTTRIGQLDISYNQLTGSIPTELLEGRNKNVIEWVINLSHNQLTGSLPYHPGYEWMVHSVDLSYNQLSGSFPIQWWDLYFLNYLDLSHNNLTGTLPSLDLAKISPDDLNYLDLSYNDLTGVLPTYIGNGLPSLEKFYVDANQLKGTLPSSITSLHKLNDFRFDCDLTSTDSTIISFLNNIKPGWGNSCHTISGSAGADGVILTYTDSITKTVTSAADGSYQISVPDGWNGTVTPSKTGYTFMPPSKDYSASPVVSNLTGQDYSASTNTYTISGSVDMAGVSLSYTGDSPVTSASDGTYHISVPYGWNGTVTPSKAGYTFAPPSKDYSVAPGPVVSDLTGQNYTATLNTYTISGNAGSGGATISYTGGSPVTSAVDGSYQISVPYGWSGTVTPSKTGYTFTPPSKDYSASPVVASLSGQDYAATATNFSATLKSSGAQDGWILESSKLSSKGGSMNTKATTINLGDDATKKQYLGILSFDTGAALQDNAVVTSVILRLKKQSVVGGGNPVSIFKGFVADIKDGAFNLPALEIKDFQAAASHSYGPFSPTLAAGGWYGLDLSAGSAFINDLGLTQIRLRFKLADNSNAVANYLSIFSGNAPAASQPQLIITYHLP